MKTRLTKSALFGATCLAGGAALFAAAPAFAQDAQPQDAQTSETEAAEDTIVVTGSLIQNPNLVQSNPVNVTTADTIELKQSNTAEEVLREVPGIVPNVGANINNGNAGASFVDLRGLGASRNVVLLDGIRIVPTGTGGSAGRTDLNNIPLALINRVDSLTGAAVTTYGADAITGVVNFVTKKNFAGVELNLSNQLTEKGDGNYLRADLTIGANFDDGRGNAVLSIGYQESDPVYQGDRDYSTFQVDSFSGTFGGSGTSVPSRFSSTRPLIAGTNTPNTTAPFVQTGVDAMGRPILAPVAGGVANGGVRQVNAQGQAVPTFAFFNFNPFNIFQTPFKRFNIFAQANYEVSDAVEVYARGLFSKNEVNTIVAPSGSFGATTTINLNNPFLPATLRNQFCAFNVAPVVAGVNAAGAAVAGQATYVPFLTQAQCDAAATATGPTDPNYRTVTATLNRRAVENGPRIDQYTNTTFDYRLGLRGELTDNINWDVAGSYGESEAIQLRKNYTLTSRVRQASLAGGTPANPVCITATNGCVPVNLFGDAGSITAAMARFLSADSSISIKSTLGQVRGVIDGDLGFTMPGASEPVGFALGAEYRNYTTEQNADFLAGQAGELGGAGGARPDYVGGYDVYEGYAELIAPIFDSLTIEGGARYSHYKIDGGGTKNTFTYKGGLTFQPIDDIKLRANYAHAVRSPNLNELFLPIAVGLTNLAVDPCAGLGPVANANLRAVCIAQGAPAGTIGSITNPTAAQANIAAGGNVNLDPEKADTYTFGAVFQPAFLPRFSLSVDYYHIKVTDVIGAPTPGDLVSACFGAPPYALTAAAASDPACTVIRRNPITGGLDGDPATTQGLFAPNSNLGKLNTDGIDVIANYSREFGKVGWAVSFVGNYTLNSKFKASPSSINRECVGYYSVNCSFTGSLQPKFQWSLRNTFTIEDIDLSVLWRHIDGMEQEPLDITTLNGPGFQGTLPATGGGGLNGRTVDFQKIPSYDIFDLTARFNISDNITFTAAIQNLFDKQPPIVGNTVGSTTYNSGNTYPATYDTLGRRYAVSAKVTF